MRFQSSGFEVAEWFGFSGFRDDLRRAVLDLAVVEVRSSGGRSAHCNRLIVSLPFVSFYSFTKRRDAAAFVICSSQSIACDAVHPRSGNIDELP